MDTNTTATYMGTGPEMTGSPDLDKRLTELRKLREKHTEEAWNCQNEIDKIILDSVAPDIKKGGWWRLDSESGDWYNLFKVESVRRSSNGIYIYPEVTATVMYEEDRGDTPSELIIVKAEESIYADRRQIKAGRLKKSSRLEFLNLTREAYESIARSTSEETEDKNQLKLDLQTT